jgi:hypothetical protein
MQNAEWISLFRQLPQEVHSQLILVFQNRQDISVETILRIDASYLAVRGRLGGTTESGLMFIVPYAQLSSVYLNREVREEEVAHLLGAANGRLNIGSHQGAARVAQPAGDRPGPSATPVPSQPVAPAVAARNNLLERLRAARNAAQQSQTSGK